jgi:hypothetical protein
MAAGLGFKTFVTGDVLTAGDTNGYLMQGVWVFASAAARDAAVTSPQEGNVCYLKDTDAVMTYSGSAWVAVGGTASFNTARGVVATAESTTSTSFVGLTTALAVTVTTGTKALVSLGARMGNGTATNTGAFMGVAVSGATTLAASDQNSAGYYYFGSTVNYQPMPYATFLITGLTAGSNVFTTQYRSLTTDSITFTNRIISVVNLGS